MADEFQKTSRPPIEKILGKLVTGGNSLGQMQMRPDGGMAVGGMGNEGLTPAEVQQLATFLYQINENINFLNENGGGGGGSDPVDPGGDMPSPPGDIDPALLRDLSNSTLFPFTYALLYDNRNEFTARSSSGGAWVVEYSGITQPLVRQQAYDFSIPF